MINPFVASVSAPRAGLELIDFLGLLIYFIVTVGIVLWSSRRQTGTEEYFLGGRRMPWLAVGLSLLATLMSSISYMGMPGEVIRNGITMMASYLAVPFSMTVVLGVWVPFFMRLKFTSAYEYLEKRFDHRIRILGSLLFLFLRLGWMSMVMYVGSLALVQMTSSLIPAEFVDPVAKLLVQDGQAIPHWRETVLYWVIVAVGLLATVYSYMGGFRAAIWNDVLQSLMLLGGTLVTLSYVYWTTGTGPVQWWEIASANSSHHTSPILFSLDPTVRMTIFTAALLSFSWTICTHGSDQVVLQRYFSTDSLSSARRSYMVNAFVDLTIGVLLALCGLALLSFYLKHPDFLPEGVFVIENGQTMIKRGDVVLPHFFAHQLPPGIGGVILAVLLCDAMQTLVSGVNSISAVFTTDILSHLKNTGKSKIGEMNLAKLLTLIVGLCVTFIAAMVAFAAQRSGKNIIEMMAPAFNMFLGPLASMFAIGMFVRCGSGVALVSVISSVIISFLWSYWQWLFGTEYSLTFTLAVIVPYLSSIAIAFLLGLFIKPASNDPALAYTWWQVMKRKADAAN